MKIQELIRNLIQTNSICSYIYDYFCSTKIYSKYINKRIMERMEYLKNHNEIKFMIETSGICNAKCIFCPYDKLKRPHTIMSDEIFNKIIYRIKEEKISPVCFDLFMVGEPFLDKKIFERIKILKEEFPYAPINITSNFSICTNEIIQQLVEADINSINISLNAVSKENYKSIMGLDYDKTTQNIKNLIKERNNKKSKLRISLSMVIYNNEKLLNIIKFFIKWVFSVDTLRFQKAVTWGGSIDVTKSLSQIKHKVYPCNDLFERLPILSNGDYALCCQDAQGIINLNVDKLPILEAWNSKIYSEIRKIHLSDELKNYDMCKDCFGINSNGANWIFIDR